MLFTPSELEFLRSQRMGRVATVGPSGWPHVVPVMYALDEEGAFEFDVDGVKLRNLKSEPRAAIVVDAMGPKRGVAVQGRAELIAPERARLTPVRKFSWGLSAQPPPNKLPSRGPPSSAASPSPTRTPADQSTFELASREPCL